MPIAPPRRAGHLSTWEGRSDMKISIVLSSTALAVAVFGSTPLGHAALDGSDRAVLQAKPPRTSKPNVTVKLSEFSVSQESGGGGNVVTGKAVCPAGTRVFGGGYTSTGSTPGTASRSRPAGQRLHRHCDRAADQRHGRNRQGSRQDHRRGVLRSRRQADRARVGRKRCGSTSPALIGAALFAAAGVAFAAGAATIP